jgi:uncharacterized membrane protein YgcG
VSGPRRFDPSEVRAPGQADPPLAEQADALLAARELETLAADDAIRPTEGFEDRVMAAIAMEPAPRLVLMPAGAVRGGRVGVFVAAVGSAWRVATTGGRPLAVRAQALAFVLLVVVAAGTLTSAAAVGVGSLLGRDGGPAPSVLPAPTDSPAPTIVAPTPSVLPDPSMTTDPSGTPEATETAGEIETAEPTDDSTDGRETARPRRTPRATETPEPTETPEGTDDHGGGSGSDGGGGGDSGGSGHG